MGFYTKSLKKSIIFLLLATVSLAENLTFKQQIINLENAKKNEFHKLSMNAIQSLKISFGLDKKSVSNTRTEEYEKIVIQCYVFYENVQKKTIKSIDIKDVTPYFRSYPNILTNFIYFDEVHERELNKNLKKRQDLLAEITAELIEIRKNVNSSAESAFEQIKAIPDSTWLQSISVFLGLSKKQDFRKSIVSARWRFLIEKVITDESLDHLSSKNQSMAIIDVIAVLEEFLAVRVRFNQVRLAIKK